MTTGGGGVRPWQKVPARAQLYELELTPEELSVAILDILDGVVHYEDTYAERSVLSDGER